MKKYPLIIKPSLNHAVWAGQGLNKYYSTDKNISEAFVLSTVEGKMSYIDNGSLKGKELGDVLTDYPYWIDQKESELFPLKIMLASTGDFPSIQVHPNDVCAMKLNSLGKSEFWYVINASEDSGVYVGFNKDTNKAEVMSKIKDGTILDIMNFKKVKAGDIIEIDGCNLHTMTKGITLLAIQENCDITYRLYDFNRHNSNRPLNLKEGLNVANFAKTDNFVVKLPIVLDKDNVIYKKDFEPYFSFSEVDTSGTIIDNDKSLVWLLNLGGEMVIEYVRMGKLLQEIVPSMRAVIIPRGLRCRIKNKAKFIKIERC